MEVKAISKEKIARHVSTIDPNLTEEQVNDLVNDVDAVQKLVHSKMSKAVHNQVKNAMNDINEKYKELGKLEKNVKELFNMIQELSMIVKNQSDIINSIESNLTGTRDYIKKAADALEKAQVEHKKGNSRMCCIIVMIICITLCLMWPVMSML
jgi:syntaxin 1B/2/3